MDFGVIQKSMRVLVLDEKQSRSRSIRVTRVLLCSSSLRRLGHCYALYIEAYTGLCILILVGSGIFQYKYYAISTEVRKTLLPERYLFINL